MYKKCYILHSIVSLRRVTKTQPYLKPVVWTTTAKIIMVICHPSVTSVLNNGSMRIMAHSYLYKETTTSYYIKQHAWIFSEFCPFCWWECSAVCHHCDYIFISINVLSFGEWASSPTIRHDLCVVYMQIWLANIFCLAEIHMQIR